MTTHSTSSLLKLYGTSEPVDSPVELKAGNLCAELRQGALRNIRFGGIEVLREISYVTRDCNWGTYTPEITELSIEQQNDAFRVSYSVVAGDNTQKIETDILIEGRSDGTLTVSSTSLARADFKTNRSGFVVLHPLDGVVGKSLALEQSGVGRIHSRFPTEISPSQPFFNIKSLSHRISKEFMATVRFEGTTFEMEDHRNWMDASFKTYSGSLLEPWPYTIKEGERFAQRVKLSFAGAPPKKRGDAAAQAIPITIGNRSSFLPEIGSGLSLENPENAMVSSELVSDLNLGYLVGRLDARDANLTSLAAQLGNIANSLDLPIELEVILTGIAPASTDMKKIANEVRKAKLKPKTVVVTQANHMRSFQPTDPLPGGPDYEELASSARSLFPGVPIGGGALAFFTELNRLPVPSGVFDFIVHSVCPTVHASDDLTVAQNIQSIEWIARSTRKMVGDTPYHLGPSWLSSRLNPYAATVARNEHDQRICLADTDPRQRGIFGASWLLAMATAFSYAELNSIALASLTGPQGLLQFVKQGQPSVVPAYHVVAGLARHSGCKTIAVENGAPGKVSALALDTSAGLEIWLANLTSSEQSVRLNGVAQKFRAHFISEDTFDLLGDGRFMDTTGLLLEANTLNLNAHAVARLSASSTDSF